MVTYHDKKTGKLIKTTPHTTISIVSKQNYHFVHSKQIIYKDEPKIKPILTILTIYDRTAIYQGSQKIELQS